jgi:hypothetical protein
MRSRPATQAAHLLTMKAEIKDKLDRLGDTLVSGFQARSLARASMLQNPVHEKCDAYQCILSLSVALTSQPPTSATQ